MTLEERMQEHVSKFSDLDWEIYDRIQDVPLEKLSMERIAGECHVSTTTIFRFCKKLGLEGFSELKALLKNSRELPVEEAEELSSYYHSIVDYIASYDTSYLFTYLTVAKDVYIFARSESELRIAKEMQRIFFQNHILVYILTSDESLLSRWEQMDRAVLFVLQVDMSQPIPFVLRKNLDKETCYRVLFSPLQTPRLLADDYFLLPIVQYADFTNSITPFILAIEVLYLKLITL